MGFLLLGVDSLIACIAVGPIMSRRLLVLSSFAVLFGVGDGGGYLLGTAFHWSVPDDVSNVVETGFLVMLGIYWITLAVYSKWAAKQEHEQTSKAHWAVWALPWVLSVDNITYGLVNGIPAHYSLMLNAASRRCRARSRPASGSRSASASPTCSPRYAAVWRWPTGSPAAS
jgi:hypothetical protein